MKDPNDPVPDTTRIPDAPVAPVQLPESEAPEPQSSCPQSDSEPEELAPASQGEGPPRQGLSRRGMLGLLGAGTAVGAGAGVVGTLGVTRQAAQAPLVYPFHGERQGGITTPVQDHMHFAAFDMMARAKREDLIALLQDWSYAAARMMAGLDASVKGALGGPPQAPPEDTGEALDLPASGLTITFGFGPTLFDLDGADRFGLAAKKPAGLVRLPPFVGEDLQPLLSDGDLCIQACANDPQVAVHAIRNLSRIAFGRARLRWSQLGFGRTSKTTKQQKTPRNLFGYKDGTANVLATDTGALDAHVWVGSDDQPWLTGGAYLVARKIAMLIEIWDRTRLEEQDRIIGRNKGEGAPLSSPTGAENDTPDFSAATQAGRPMIDVDAHMRLAHPDHNSGIKMLRRGYNYVDGNDRFGKLSAGLFFLSFHRHPDDFVKVQRSLSIDALNEYIQHIGSGLWAVPPGAAADSYIGAGLFT